MPGKNNSHNRKRGRGALFQLISTVSTTVLFSTSTTTVNVVSPSTIPWTRTKSALAAKKNQAAAGAAAGTTVSSVFACLLLFGSSTPSSRRGVVLRHRLQQTRLVRPFVLIQATATTTITRAAGGRPFITPSTSSTVMKASSSSSASSDESDKSSGKDSSRKPLLEHGVVASWLSDNWIEACSSIQDNFGRKALEYVRLDQDESKNSVGEVCIRVEDELHPDIKDITTTEQVLRRIQETMERQRELAIVREVEDSAPTAETTHVCRTSLYTRTWNPSLSDMENQNEQEPVNGGSPGGGVDIVNGYGVNGDHMEDHDRGDSSSFVVLQFNGLARGLSAGPDVGTPFDSEGRSDEGTKKSKGNSKDDYGGFTDVSFPDVALEFEYRKWRLLQVLLMDHGGHLSMSAPSPSELPSVIAMEECDVFYGFFQPLLRLFGYEGIFVPKPSSPAVRLGWYSDGCALFWNEKDFSLVSSDRKSYSQGNQVAILSTLESKKGVCDDGRRRRVLVAVTHLKAQATPANEKLRIQQAKELLEWIGSKLAEEEDGDNISVLVCGDFNSQPPANSKSFTPTCVGTMLQKQKPKSDGSLGTFALQSAYDWESDTSLWTTWKTRGTKTVKRVIDYVLYDGLECTSILQPPKNEQDREPHDPVEALPSLRYPSDHICLGVMFRFPDKRQLD